MIFRALSFVLLAAGAAWTQDDLMTSKAVGKDFALTADPAKGPWKNVKGVTTSHGRWGEPVKGSRTEIRSVWTPTNLYFLFINHFETQHLKANPSATEETWGLWEYDVSEVFIGHDLQNINVYKEFEVTPQSEWVDLDVDKSKKPMVDWKWNSNLKVNSRVDQANKIWYCEMQIPWKAIAVNPAEVGQLFRLNLYRIEGKGEGRKYLAWRPVNAPSYHTPEAFGKLRLIK